MLDLKSLETPNRSASPHGRMPKGKAAEIAIQTDENDYADIPIALERKVESLMRRRLSSLLGIKQYVGGDSYGASANVTQARVYSHEQQQAHELQLAKQTSFQFRYGESHVSNMRHTRRQSAFLPVLGNKRSKSKAKAPTPQKEQISHTLDTLLQDEHIVNIIEINNLVVDD